MTAVDTSLDSIKQSLELDKVESHLHPEGSFDLAAHPVPTGREEIWRFTPLKRLRDLHTEAAFGGTLDITEQLAEGINVSDDASGLLGVSGFVPTDRIAARVANAAHGTALYEIPAETVIEDASVIIVRGTGVEQAVAQHVVVKAGRFSQATVVFHFEGSATLADNVEIVVEDGAQLTVVTIDDWADDAVHVGHRHVKVGRDATFKHIEVTFGGDVVRSDTTAEYSGPGGSVELLGLYFADAGQHIEHRLFVDHTAPKTKSHVVYKGALQGHGAHTVWIGNVLIRKVAEGIETYEENRNLVLTDGCQADSVPNLEIETGEIEGAGHASAVGRFDDEQLFYLRSRGIPESEARRLVVHGFFNDLIRQIGVGDLEEKLTATVEAELAKNVLNNEKDNA
ncbi:Fe-S cluster assembly protein SufD [Nocardioides nematodiphilus]|uniref:Fe-S cluster assembly protein SufD n=1 Tax=Nocardioides nematodiphilus TaxID=2849669 RepID=UPI001CD937B9|nr:Fe-S cluster assembly protein SufD [Nocardioides nematodiphilus]MCA1981937.1 Fe-S cluster assembly protein SufD [Nocardioides nematodiphilus]